MKRLPATVLLFSFIFILPLSACSRTAIDWVDFVKWDGVSYENTGDIAVPAELIGDQLGKVRETAPSVVYSADYQPKDGQAGHLAAGTELYTIDGYDSGVYIAVLLDGEYLLYKTHDSETVTFEEDATAVFSPSEEESKNNAAPDAGDAYYTLFLKLYGEDTALNSDIQYLALDLTLAKLADPDRFLELMEAFCEDEGLTLMQDTVEGLTEKGYIRDLYFEHGIVIAFADSSLTDTMLCTQASKWRSGLGSIGGDYTLEKKAGIWTVTASENNWIS